jgi:AcrR family transcriptional regulator
MTKFQRINRSDGDQTSRQILEAAGPLFARVGLAETTNKAIAECAGIDVALINYHFGGRAGLYESCLIEAHRQLISLKALEMIEASSLAAEEKLARLIDALVAIALASESWPAHLLAREVLSPSSHFQVMLSEEIEPKLVVVQRIFGELTKIPLGDPSLVRCMFSVAAPCLMLAVASNGIPGPAQMLRKMSKEDLSNHLYTFALAGLKGIARRD